MLITVGASKFRDFQECRYLRDKEAKFDMSKLDSPHLHRPEKMHDTNAAVTNGSPAPKCATEDRDGIFVVRHKRQRMLAEDSEASLAASITIADVVLRWGRDSGL